MGAKRGVTEFEHALYKGQYIDSYTVHDEFGGCKVAPASACALGLFALSAADDGDSSERRGFPQNKCGHHVSFGLGLVRLGLFISNDC
ncbi:hypothetical protein EVAR_95071_1 [Eumeta japonica]|uniref:Uncharacterized protein n=1 Tax=Eumeta variegata TaxID=151549 RepID=A0A4C1W7Y0_EUMVA|nr:hypothetical protein EVAR_95071_1 [Eumeta japonica]